MAILLSDNQNSHLTLYLSFFFLKKSNHFEKKFLSVGQLRTSSSTYYKNFNIYVHTHYLQIT